MQYAYVNSQNIVIAVLTAVEGFSFEESFPVEIIKNSFECSSEVSSGWIFDQENNSFSEPLEIY